MNSCFGRKTAAYASSGSEQLHLLQLQKQDRRQSIAEGIFTPSYELTFALGENSCKCFTWARTAVNASATKAAEYCRRSLHQATNSQTAKCFEQLQMFHMGRASAMRHMYCAVQHSASVCSMAQFPFSQRKNRFIQKMKHNLLGIDACFECQNDAVSKILRVTDTNIMTTITLCACTEG